MCWDVLGNELECQNKTPGASRKLGRAAVHQSSVDLAGSGVPPVYTATHTLHGAIAGPSQMSILCFVHSSPRPLRGLVGPVQRI